MPSTVHSVDVWLVSSTFITSFTNCLNLWSCSKANL
jgi:hypothetical protein